MKIRRNGESQFSPLVFLAFIVLIIYLPKPKFASATSAAYDFYYYSSGRKIYLPISTEKLAVRFAPTVSPRNQIKLYLSEPQLGPLYQREDLSGFALTLLPLREDAGEQDVIQAISNLNTKTEVQFATPVFSLPNGDLYLTDEFLVKFNPSVSLTEINAFNRLHNVETVESLSLDDWYLLKVKDASNVNTLRIANL